MLGFGDYNATLCGLMLILVSMVFCFYALYLFVWRTKRIREKDTDSYDDLYGPTILVFMFLVAMTLSAIFKFP